MQDKSLQSQNRPSVKYAPAAEYKVIFLGDDGVGKSTIISRLLHGKANKSGAETTHN